jgi:RimJ/RimL family protein N-acetyltransferase
MTEQHPLAHKETAEALFTQWSPYWDLSKPYLVEKTPITLTRTRLFQALFPDAYFVAIVRHPAAVALATYNAYASFMVPDLTITDLIENWVRGYEILKEDAPHLKRFTRICYEDFAQKHQETMGEIYRFLGLPGDSDSEPIRGDIDMLYRRQWQAMRRDPLHQEDIERTTLFEERVQRLGYNLQAWSASEPPELSINNSESATSPIAETERLILRPFTFADVDHLAVLYKDPETMRFWGGIQPRERAWGEILGYLRGYEESGHAFWAVVDKADGHFIGRCGLYLPEQDNPQEAELGYQIARPYWGRGLGTEAARAVTEYSFRNGPFQRLISLIDPANIASVRVAEKLGMSLEATQRENHEETVRHRYVVNREGSRL